MDFLKPVFDDKALTYDQLTEKLAAAKDIKLANLAGGGYVVREKLSAKESEVEGLKKQLEAANKQIDEFKGMDIDGIRRAADEWKQKAEKAEKDAADKLAAAEFDRQLESAITAAKGRNAKAIRSLLDIDALRASKDQSQDIRSAIEAVKAENDYMFDSATPTPRIAGPTPGLPVSGMDAVRIAAGLKAPETK